MATPPTGLSRDDQTQGDSNGPPCPRCGTRNAAHMRFCNNCGYQVDAQPRRAAPAAEARAPEPRPAPPPSPFAASEIESNPSAEAGGGVCWRCYGVGDPGAEFCKFCGARYADAPSRARAEPEPAREPTRESPREREPAPAPREPERRGRTADARGAGEATTRASLVSILKDGSDGRRYPIFADNTDIGREEGQIVLSDDPYLSPRHARVTYRGGKPVLRDLDSVNGVYIRIHEPVEIAHGDMMLLGQQVLRFEVLSESELPLGPAMQHGAMVFGTPEVQRVARLVQYTTEGVGRDVHYLYRDETVIGREQGDVVFTDDPFMSRRHAAVTIDRAARKYVLRDLGSSNGSAIRFRGERILREGDQFRVGRHLFRFESGEGLR